MYVFHNFKTLTSLKMISFSSTDLCHLKYLYLQVQFETETKHFKSHLKGRLTSGNL